ncbi:hypothetical protein [Foetidibacter luteolus]|uniref:hypothetical protein n=1 Tax=Foetidibacter luteolus TaxID=2608880 RepID=UPI00129B0D77|nr:hypothetical protein [Foetidibacter luteolus]
MLLNIDDRETIAEMQERFNNSFPKLWLEFFDKAHGWNKASVERDKLDPGLVIAQIRHKHTTGTFQIKSTDKAGEIERIFKKVYGLFVQVCYYKNGRWVETEGLDDYTLAELSAMAE